MWVVGGTIYGATPGVAVMSEVIWGVFTVVAEGMVGWIWVGWVLSGRSVLGEYALVKVGALLTLDTRRVLDLDCFLLTTTRVPTNSCNLP